MENEYFKRNIDAALTSWVGENGRKPLLLRGARQVGKTEAVRTLGKRFKHYVEINFDSDTEVSDFFRENLEPAELCKRLALYVRTPIVPGETLLFFDEIQSCTEAIKSLRYFYEKYPQQHIIAAGSLLEFALAEIPSFGVGRLHMEFMYPFSFYEFLGALGEEILAEACRNAGPDKPLPQPVHKQLVDRLKIFLLAGGMPEAVANYVQALDLLEMAGLVIPVTHSAANGIPLGAEINPKNRRVIPCDTGIFLHILGIDKSEILLAKDFQTVNRGALAEIFVGLELLKNAGNHARRQLYFWSREKAQSSAQIDYLIQRGSAIIPIEVKSGIQGGMKSLNIFMKEKNISRGIRTSLENFARKETFDVYPLYAVSNLQSGAVSTF